MPDSRASYLLTCKRRDAAMNALSADLHDYLLGKGASLCGFADLSGIVQGELQHGVSVAVRLPVPVLQSIAYGPSRIYFDAYHDINEKLDSLVLAGAEYLQSKGYHAHAKTRANVQEHSGYRTDLPHKTVATRAGLGWIGKSALLVTREFGPAVRISSLLTDAPLTMGEPIDKSKCGNCTACTDHCPGKAISGKLWEVKMDRDEFFDAAACRKAARALSFELLNEEITLCGKCIEVCPYTKGYIHRDIIGISK
jgi:epoxyqueuosine reductase QueG